MTHTRAHIPFRSCRVCRKQLPKTDLQRWTVVAGEFRLDRSQTAPGRGYYTCSERCTEILPKTIKRKK